MTLTSPTQDPAQTGTPSTEQRAPRGFMPGIGVANFGIHLALMTPIVITLSLRVRHIVLADMAGMTAEAVANQAATQLGLVLGIGAIFAMIANPLFGRLSDRTTSRFGRRKPWILAGSLGLTGALAVIATATNVTTVLIAWCLAQIFGNAAFAAINATIPDQVPTSQRGKAAGIIGVASPLAMLFGAAWSQALPDNADFARFMVPAAVGLLATLVFVAVLADRQLQEKPAPFSWREFFGSFTFNPRKHPDFGWVWLSKFAVTYGFVGVQSYLTYYLISSLAVSEAEARKLVFQAMVVMVATTVLSALVGGRLSDRFKKRRIFVAAAGLLAVCGVLLLTLFPSAAMIPVAFGVIGLGQGAFNAVDMALATLVLPSDRQAGKDLGLLSVSSSLAQSLAPIIAPVFIMVGGGAGGSGYVVFFLCGAAISAIGSLLIFKVKSVA